MSKVILALLILTAIVLPVKVSAATATSNARDCDANAVFKCGALTTKELQIKYMNPTDASGRYILNAFGITNRDLEILETTAVLGQVTKSGEVLINGKVVANNAMTAGRLNMPGSTQATYQGVTYFRRPPSVSFKSTSLQAFVVMENNNFKFAVLTSCGNPVTASPVAPSPPPTPAPTVATPAATPSIVNNQTVIVNQAVVVEKPQEKVITVAQPAPTPAPQPKVIPATGPAGVFTIAGIISVVAGIGHWVITRRKSLLSSYSDFVLTRLYR